MKDFHAIAESFNRALIGIFHQRIEYPEDIYMEGVVEDFDTKPAEGEGGSEGAQGHGQGYVKRFGVP